MGCSGSKHGTSDPPYSQLPEDKDARKPLNVIILGRRKVGKRTVGNAILGRRVFTFWSFFHKGCVEKQGNVNGRFIKVVHTPGWTGFSHTTSEYNKGEIKYSIIHKGLVAFVLVVSIDSKVSVQDLEAANQHMGLIECGNDSVWKHTVLLFIKHRSNNLSENEIKGRTDLLCLLNKCNHRLFMFNKDKNNVTDLLSLLDNVAVQCNGIQPKNSACSQNSQMYSQCPKERAEKENGGLQQENIELQQQATTSIRRGTTQESHSELSSASENTSGQLREVYNIHTPESQQGQRDFNRNTATLEEVYNMSMDIDASEKKKLAQFFRYLIAKGFTFVELLEQRNNALFQHLAVTFVNEHWAELIQKVTTVRSIADALYSKKMVDNELNSQIQAETTSQDKMRLLYKALDSAEAVKAAFFKLLAQKQFPLVQDLAKKKLLQIEACDVDVP